MTMADLVAPVTRQTSWELLELDASNPMFTDTGAFSAPSKYAHRNNSAFWSSVTATPGLQRVAFAGTDLESNSLALSFFGLEPGSGSGPFHAIGRLWMARKLVKATDTEFRGTFLGEFELLLGGEPRIGTGGILPDDVKWVKSINPVKDRALFPGIRIVGQDEDAAAEMILDGIGAWGYILELRCSVPNGASGSAMAAVGAMRVIL
jgi:hypothetical protein